MSKPHPRGLRPLLVIILVLALSAVFSSSAQSSDLAQVTKTLDGQISVRLPAGWQSRDAAAAIFSSVLAFGDNATSLQTAVDSLGSNPQTTTAARMTGVIGIVQPSLLTGLSGDLAVSTLLNSLVANVQQQGGTVLQQESTMIANKYPGSYAMASLPGQDVKGIFGVFQAGGSIVEFTVGAAPIASFDANQELFFNIIDSISVPAEEGGAAPQPAQPTAAPPLPSSGEGSVVAGAAGTFSVRLPQGYVSEPITVSNFADTIAFGDSATAEQGAISTFVNGVNVDNFAGIGGILGEIDPQVLNGQDAAALVAPLMQSMIAAVQTGDVTLVQAPQAHTFGGQYDGQLAELSQGYIGVLQSDRHLLVAIIRTDNVAANRAELDAILNSIRIPAEAANQPPLTVPTLAAPPPTAAAPAETQTVRSGDLQVSLVIPVGFVVLDHIADGAILTYGDSSDAAMSRLYSVKPDLATETVITGIGGVVALYPMAQFGIDPANPDLTALMTRALGNLQGYTVEQEGQPLEGTPNALYAVINGTEHGYLALIPFGDLIAYVTATSAGAGDTFNANNGMLFDILKSVRVPAEQEPTPAPTASGLGGLGGLGEAEVTPEATAAGLGGL